MTTILCVEDDPAMSAVLRDLLTDAGYTVRLAATGREAHERVRCIPPNLVLLDVTLPDIDGFALLAALRASSTVPVIMLTAHDAEAEMMIGFDLGADDYVTKPFNVEVLLHRIAAVLRRTAPP